MQEERFIIFQNIYQSLHHVELLKIFIIAYMQ